MATRSTPRESLAGSQVESTIRVQTGQGVVHLPYRAGDTIADLRLRLQHIHREPNGRRFTFSGGMPGDTVEELGDSRLLQTIEHRGGVLRAELVQSPSAPPRTSRGSNSIETAAANGPGTAIQAGDRFSDAAFQYMFGRSGQLPLVDNSIINGRADGGADIYAGQRYGGSPVKNGGD